MWNGGGGEGRARTTRGWCSFGTGFGEEAKWGIRNWERRVRVGVGVGVGTLRENHGWGVRGVEMRNRGAGGAIWIACLTGEKSPNYGYRLPVNG
jgi:hypothetical protein